MKTALSKVILILALLGLPYAAMADVYDDAVANAARPAADRERDAGSKPAEIMRFAGVKAGDTVMDLLAAGGYYTELLAAVAGPTGNVLMQNNTAYRGFVGAPIDERVAGGRLANVTSIQGELEALDIPQGSVDVVWASMTYHDAYFVSEGWTVTADTFFAGVNKVLKPGGTVLIIDHHGRSGTGSSEAGTLHRIDAAFARADFEAHGYTFVGSSSVLENTTDDMTKSVFDPAVQGTTSRFVYKFTRP